MAVCTLAQSPDWTTKVIADRRFARCTLHLRPLAMRLVTRLRGIDDEGENLRRYPGVDLPRGVLSYTDDNNAWSTSLSFRIIRRTHVLSLANTEHSQNGERNQRSQCVYSARIGGFARAPYFALF